MNRTDFFDALNKGARWDVGVSIKRSNPLPLDDKSVFKSYTDLEEYAAGVLAYPGQVVAVVEDSKTTIYYLDGNCAIKPVGIIPTGDDKTVEVTSEGEISLKGAAEAKAGQQPRIVNKGTAEAPKLELEWFTPDNSSVEGLQTNVGALQETVDGVVAEDGSVTKAGLVHKVAAIEEEIGAAAEGETAATGIYKVIDDKVAAIEVPVDGVAEGEKVISLTNKKLSTTLSIAKTKKDDKTYIQLLGKDNAVISEFDAAEFIADGMLESVTKNENDNTIIFKWNTTAGVEETIIDIDDLVEVYTAGNGIDIADFVVSVKRDATSEDFLTVGANGIKLSGVQDAIDNAVSGKANSSDLNNYYTKEEIAGLDHATKTEVSTALTEAKNYADGKITDANLAQYATKEELNTAKSDLQTYADQAETDAIATADAHTAAKIGDLKVSGDAEVTVKDYVDAKAASINGTITTLEKNLGDLAKLNQVTEDKLAEGLATKINGKAEQSDLNTLSENVTKGFADAKSYTDTEIGKLDTKAQGYANSAKSGAISEANAYTDAEIDKIEASITEIGTKDANQDKSISENAAAIAKNAENIAKNTEALTNVYTKEEANDKIDEVIEGLKLDDTYAAKEHTHVAKDITDLDSTIKAYDYATKAEAEGYANAKDSAIAEAKKAGDDAQATADAIAKDYLKAADKTALQEQITANAEAITLLTDGADPDKVDSVKDLIDYVDKHGTEVTGMKADISANAKAIADHDAEAKATYETKTDASNKLAEAKSYADGLVVDLEQAKHTHENKTVLDGITADKVSAWDAAEQNAKDYADNHAKDHVKYTDLENNGWQNYIPVATLENLGVVKSSEAVNKVKVAADGTMEVNNINISKLVQDEGQVFVLDGNVW